MSINSCPYVVAHPSPKENTAFYFFPQYKPPMPRKRSGTNQGETKVPPGANLVARNTNFSGTYTVVDGAQPTDGTAGGYPTRAGSIPRTNTRVSTRTRQPSGPAAMTATRTTAKGVFSGIRAGNLPGNTPGTHKYPQPPSGPAPAIRRQTSFSRRGGNVSGAENQETAEQTAFGRKPPFGGSGSGTRVPSVSTTRGIVVRNSTSRRLYEYSSDEQEDTGGHRHNGEVPNGHVQDLDARSTDLRRIGRDGKGRFASSGGSERSSSPQSDVDSRHTQRQQLVATQTRRESRGR